MSRSLLLSASLVASAAGHGLMNYPPTRSQNSMATAGLCIGDHPEHSPQNGTCLWFNQGCTIGCATCTGGNCLGKSCCDTSMAPTLDEKFRTYKNLDVIFDFTRHNPWRAPGHAPVESACGLAGGWYKEGAPGNGGLPPKGIEQGFDGKDMPAFATTLWPAGSKQEVSWSIVANHGGGYAYRLCPKSREPSESCFQEHHMNFVGNTSWIEFGQVASVGKANRTAIHADRVSTGTWPKGSQWTKNPIPACSGADGGAIMGKGCGKPQFAPPMDSEDFPIAGGRTQRGLYGFGAGRCTSGLPGKSCTEDEMINWAKRFNFNIIDLVQVPADLPEGDYVLSFRWDCEQTPQIWSNCADIKITSASKPTAFV